MPMLLVLASGVGLVAATAALWVQGWPRADHRFFAGLISIAVTLSLFSVVAWAATAIAPLPLTWVLVGTLALLSPGISGLRRRIESPRSSQDRMYHAAAVRQSRDQNPSATGCRFGPKRPVGFHRNRLPV